MRRFRILVSVKSLQWHRSTAGERAGEAAAGEPGQAIARTLLPRTRQTPLTRVEIVCFYTLPHVHRSEAGALNPSDAEFDDIDTEDE